MSAAARNAAVPAALRPKSPAPSQVVALAPVTPPAPGSSPVPGAPPTYHLALVVPDVRLQRLLRDHVYLIGPTTAPATVVAHAVIDDKTHSAAGLHPFMRWALVETGLLTPAEVGFITPVEADPGWATHDKDTR